MTGTFMITSTSSAVLSNDWNSERTASYILAKTDTPCSTVGKTTKLVHCAITGPCLRMRHRPLAHQLHRFGRFTAQPLCNSWATCCVCSVQRSKNWTSYLLKLCTCLGTVRCFCHVYQIFYGLSMVIIHFGTTLLKSVPFSFI